MAHLWRLASLSFEILYSYTQLNHLQNEWSTNPLLLLLKAFINLGQPSFSPCLCSTEDGRQSVHGFYLRSVRTHTSLQSHGNYRTDFSNPAGDQSQTLKSGWRNKPLILFGQSSQPVPLFWVSVQFLSSLVTCITLVGAAPPGVQGQGVSGYL